jgi:hypothetical protein
VGIVSQIGHLSVVIKSGTVLFALAFLLHLPGFLVRDGIVTPTSHFLSSLDLATRPICG